MDEPKVGVKYNPGEIEKKWITRWEAEQTYATPARGERSKSYVLGMFPYPSGEGLHTGHGRIFTAVDVIARYQRMKGLEVLCPMGWDAFGLPAENAAIKAKKNPVDMVPSNEANFKRQMMMLGLSFDWNRAFSTTDPAYYKWTQWLFLKLYSIKNDKGERLVYRKEVPINWCPFCKTGLANEEVQADGTHERCGTAVTQKLLPQWNMRITDYADRLLKDLDGLDWPEGILAQQRNWIGKKEGIEIDYQVVGSKVKITCFTTTPVNFGATFIIVSPEHPILASDLIPEGHRKKVEEYWKQAAGKTEQARLEGEKEKTGEFTGLYVINHVTEEKIPVWVSDFVLMNVGTGAIQGCPAHDERDFDFAVKFGLPIKRVVTGPNGETDAVTKAEQVAAKNSRGKMVNSDFLDGLEFVEAMEKTKNYFVKKGWGRRVTTYHLRDWVFSRQRYWGEPFPLVYCAKCGDPTSLKLRGASENDTTVIDGKRYAIVPLAGDQLPLTLPYLASYEPTETGESPLARAKDWVETTCPNCGGKARRETDTMPNWAGSCWYYLFFALSSKEKFSISNFQFSRKWEENFGPAMKEWLPVDWYLGGAEHAVLHLLYARFWTKAFNDLGLLSFSEPFLRLRSVGMVLATDGKKMSKSLGNVINPDEVVAEFGADAVRIYEMFMGPWDQTIAWNSRSLIGCRRFIDKIWELASRDTENNWKTSDAKLTAALSKLIKKVGEDIGLLKFNTAVAAAMKFANAWAEAKTGLSHGDLKKFLQTLAPLAPFVTEELWQALGETGSIHLSVWPEAGEVSEKELTMVVQVNGKMRVSLVVETVVAKDQAEMEKLALADERVKKWVSGKYKAVFVPGRLINFVVE